jgi:ATP-binding protein involved in chromosome partitioning
MSATSSASATEAQVLLEQLLDPETGRGLMSAGVVQGLVVDGARASCMIEAPRAEVARYAPIRDAVERVLRDLPGVDKVQVALTTSAPEPAMAVAPPRRAGASVTTDPRANPSSIPPAEALANVRRIIAVASGKGGVGKSTIAVNLACAFAGLGLRAGLLDADIYGPSAPRMLGLDAKPVFEDGKLIPLEAYGLRVMSIGFIVEEGRAMIWRGPMVSSAIRQMIGDVRWGGEDDPLDILVVDLPPGTGDIHLTLVQKLKIDGVVIVSTPQEIALIDARRASAMFAMMNPPVPILGVVENMAYFPDPTSGARIPIFGTGGARVEAERLGVPFLGEVPIDIALREGGDAGKPVTAVSPDSAVARVFVAMARKLTPSPLAGEGGPHSGSDEGSR